MSTGVLKAVQLTTNGFVTQKRALFKMLMIFHPLSGDSSYKFYDINTVPTGSEPHYTFPCMEKAVTL